MSDLQQFTCPECDAVGANRKGDGVPLCHICPTEVYMQPSVNGKITKPEVRYINVYYTEYGKEYIFKTDIEDVDTHKMLVTEDGAVVTFVEYTKPKDWISGKYKWIAGVINPGKIAEEFKKNNPKLDRS